MDIDTEEREQSHINRGERYPSPTLTKSKSPEICTCRPVTCLRYRLLTVLTDSTPAFSPAEIVEAVRKTANKCVTRSQTKRTPEARNTTPKLYFLDLDGPVVGSPFSPLFSRRTSEDTPRTPSPLVESRTKKLESSSQKKKQSRRPKSSYSKTKLLSVVW